MKYIILIGRDYQCECGNDWMVSTEYKQHKKIMEVAQNIFRWNKYAQFAYLISNYTQKMCEMDDYELAQYVKENGLRLI